MGDEFVRLYLVRHGEVDANIELRFLGRRDDPLNSTGAAQAEELASVFAVLPIHGVVSSPLGRALQTGKAVAQAANVPLSTDDRLIELDFGSWECLTRREIRERSADDEVMLSRWEEDPAFPAPDGESLLEVQNRAVEFANEVLSASPGATVAVTSHMGPIKALLCAVLDVPLTATRRFFLDPATVTVVDWSSSPVLRLFNSHAHQGWRHARWMREPELR
jgi:broad specificity phosphatase PhoE